MDNKLAVIYIVKDTQQVENFMVHAKDVAYVLINGAGMGESYVQDRINSQGRFEFNESIVRSFLRELYKWQQNKTHKTEGEIKVIMALDAVNCTKDSHVIIQFI